jgi:hypothetical protein
MGVAMWWRVASITIQALILVVVSMALVVLVRGNYDIALMKTAQLAELGQKGLSACFAEMKKKGIEVNYFSALTPDSVRFALERGVGEERSYLQRLYEFNREPELFVGWLRVMIDLSDLKTPHYCAYNVWNGHVEIIGGKTTKSP